MRNCLQCFNGGGFLNDAGQNNQGRGANDLDQARRSVRVRESVWRRDEDGATGGGAGDVSDRGEIEEDRIR